MTILIVDDHALFRKGLARLLGTTKYSEAEFLLAGSAKEALGIIQKTLIDVILLDIQMPEMNGYDAAKAILQLCPRSKIIILSMIEELPAILYFFRIGAKGYVTKKADEIEVVNALDSVLEGNLYFSTQFDKRLIRKLNGEIRETQFTQREMEIVLHLSRGKTNKEIANVLGISVRTVEAYRAAMIEKANVKNTAELVQYVFKNGIL